MLSVAVIPCAFFGLLYVTKLTTHVHVTVSNIMPVYIMRTVSVHRGVNARGCYINFVGRLNVRS